MDCRAIPLSAAVRSAGGTAGAALAVALGYYAGANFGFILRFPPATPSVMWPPNAILTATLLLTAPRRWWIYLLAAFPAHIAAIMTLDFPPALVLALFLTNCSEALIAAVVVRQFSDAPARLDTLHRAGVLVVGVILGPLVSSFLDATVVALGRGEAYWAVWRVRLFSNVMTELALVPAIVTVMTDAPAWMRGVSLRRRVEAVILAVLLLAGVFFFTIPHFEAIPGLPRSPLAILLPLLLWAAVRFGPGGLSLALLVTVLVAITVVAHGYAAIGDLPTRDNIPALQVLFVVIAIPLMGLAALIEERRRAEEALAERLRFEELLSRLSAAFVHLPSDAMDEAFEAWLKRLGEFLGLGHLTLLRVGEDGRRILASHRWTASGAVTAANVLGWAELLREEPWGAPASTVRSPVTAGDDAGDRAAPGDLVIPLVAGRRVLGGLVFDGVTVERWPAASRTPQLKLLAEVFAGALARKETEDALRGSELMKSAILTSLPTGVAVLDRNGRIVAVNDTWTRLASQARSPDTGLDDNYLDRWRSATRYGDRDAAGVLVGIQAVLEGTLSTFAVDYADGLPPADRWYSMVVVPLDRGEGGAVVSHTDITDQKRAESDAQRNRQELAHFTRVSMMGELTASLAHELSQPLSGILTNAQAAQRFLNVSSPDLVEVRSILSDIVEDDRRAGDVVQRLRDLLRKSEVARAPLDLNVLIRDVVRLLGSDTLIRNVTCQLELHPGPVIVIGDRVQLQQVVMNLLLNAMDAMADCDEVSRMIVLRTHKTELNAIHVAIEDTGIGLDEETRPRLFEPFYTTKPSGMGMGLSICRSIVLAHNGSIWATNNPRRGATFHIALPLIEDVRR